MRSVFITGATGFIGEHITQKFVAEGWQVIALIHRAASATLNSLVEKKLISCIYGDISEIESFEGQLVAKLSEQRSNLDAVIHCAAYVSDVGRKQQFKKINYEATVAIATLAKNLGSRFVFISTTDVYGIRDFNRENEEMLPFCNNRNNNYPKYKIASEEWLKANFRSNQYVIIRPAAVWGLHDRTLTERIVDFLKWSPFVIHFGKWRGRNRWPLAHVKNVAIAAFIAVIDSSVLGKAINVLDKEEISIDDFYSMVASVYLPKKKFFRIYIPLCLMLPLSWLVTTVSNLLHLKKPFIDPSSYALFSVSSNLDFSNKLFMNLAQKCNQTIISYNEGVEELVKYNFKTAGN